MSPVIRRVFGLLLEIRVRETERCQAAARVDGYLECLYLSDQISFDLYRLLGKLALSAFLFGGQSFPFLAKPQAQVQANEKPEPVSAPASRRELRLLCLLVETASDSYTVPLGTMHPLPPRAGIKGRWPVVGSPGVVLRETQAIAPPPEVLVRLQRCG